MKSASAWGLPTLAVLALLSVVLLANTDAAGNAGAGAMKAAVCAACHGQKGVSSNPLWPNLAGQQEQYLANQIKAFRDGTRTDVSMQPFVANLTDQDIEDLAAYYASLSPCP